MTVEMDLQIAIQVASGGERERAYELFVAFIQKNPFNFYVYLWLSELAPTLEEQTFALDRAMALCPADPTSTRGLQDYLNELRGAIPLGAPAEPIPSTPEPFELLLSLEETPAADYFYQSERASLFAGQVEAERDLLARPAPDLHWVTVPSALLMVLYIFIHSDWQQFPSALLTVPALLSLLAGGLLVIASGPPPLLVQRMGRLSALAVDHPPRTRRSLRWSGWLLVLLPFTLLLHALIFIGLH